MSQVLVVDDDADTAEATSQFLAAGRAYGAVCPEWP